MFREPALYTKLSKDHLREASESITSYKHILHCSSGETVMDIGCGPGDVTKNIIQPFLHPLHSLLVGIDVSQDMVNFAKERWPEDMRIKFIVLDAAEQDENKINQSLPVHQFDKIFSFFALQWVSDRKQMVKNLYTLLGPGGEAFLVLVVNSGIYKVWDSLASSSKWSQFFQNIKIPLNEYQYMENPDKEMRTTLETTGFEVITCDMKFHRNAFSSNIETTKEKIEKVRSVDPLVSSVPDDLKDDYMRDVLDYTRNMIGPNGAVDYTSLTILCKKPK